MHRQGSIHLPSEHSSPFTSSPSRSPRRRPTTVLNWVLIASACFTAGFLFHRVPPAGDLLPTTLVNSNSSFLPSYLTNSLSTLPSSRRRPHHAFATKAPPPSCRLCDSDPTNPLCDYGDSAIRMSRAYEGSGLRVRRFLEKALRGEEVVIGVIGASVTVGHGIGDHQTWVNRWFEGFQEQFPKARLINGAAPAMTCTWLPSLFPAPVLTSFPFPASFYAYCFKTMVPEPADLYLVEMDVNDDMRYVCTSSTLLRIPADSPRPPSFLPLCSPQSSFLPSRQRRDLHCTRRSPACSSAARPSTCCH